MQITKVIISTNGSFFVTSELQKKQEVDTGPWITFRIDVDLRSSDLLRNLDLNSTALRLTDLTATSDLT